jgi:hypothetical protein
MAVDIAANYDDATPEEILEAADTRIKYIQKIFVKSFKDNPILNDIYLIEALARELERRLP